MSTTLKTPGADAPASSPARLLYPDLESELKSTRRMLERFPDGKASWQPHDKSMTLGRLATRIADIPNRGTNILEADGMDIATRQWPAAKTTAPEILAHFDAAVARLRPAIAAADQTALERPWTLRNGERVNFTLPKAALLRTLVISHLIHHRAQLGVYYRLLGVPVPGTYGPSADEAV